VSDTAPYVLFCSCENARVIPPATKEAVQKALAEADLAFETVPDLCDLAARRDPELQRLARITPLRIAACSPRAVKWLFAAAGARLTETACEVLNLRTLPAADAAARLCATTLAPNLPGTPDPINQPDQGKPQPATVAHPPPASWIPWFPVIDYDRCVNCLQCLGFCLFGVYGVDEQGHVRVQQPDHCKTLCPACARVCPEAAILFPKHSAAAINGDPVEGQPSQPETMQVDLHSLLQGDIHGLLRNRGERARTRFAGDRDADQALSERRRCLRQFGGLAADLPPEVLRDLPTPEEIARKSAEAAARVAAARKRPAPPPT